MEALTPATHFLLELSHSLVQITLFSLVLTFEQKSIPHKQTQIWALCIQCQRRFALIPFALHSEATSVVVQELQHLTNKLIEMPYKPALLVCCMNLVTKC